MSKKSFDMVSFLDDYSIQHNPYSNVTTNNFTALTCPYCGEEELLGAHLTNGYFSCWAGCEEAKDFWLTLKTLSGELHVPSLLQKYGDISFSNRNFKSEREEHRVIPTKVDLIGKDDIGEHLAVYDYIRDVRGFDPVYLFQKYNLRYTTFGCGEYNHRLVFPITYNGRVVSFQARDYTGDKDRIRFMALKKELEIIHHQEILYNLDNCTGDSLLVVEGIFDAIRLGDNASSSFGISFTAQQADLLRSKFKRVFILYDEEERAQQQAEKLGYMVGVGKTEVEVISLGESGGDPDDIFKNKNDDIIYLKKELKLY